MYVCITSKSHSDEGGCLLFGTIDAITMNTVAVHLSGAAVSTAELEFLLSLSSRVMDSMRQAVKTITI